MQIRSKLQFFFTVIFKSVRDQTAVRTLTLQSNPQNYKFFMSSYFLACEKPFGYLVFDASQKCNDLLRLRSDIFPYSKRMVIYTENKMKSKK